MNGFVAPVFFKTQQESRKDNNYVKGKLGAKHYNNDYYQELQILGVRYKFNNDNTLWASVYNERKYNQHSSNMIAGNCVEAMILKLQRSLF